MTDISMERERKRFYSINKKCKENYTNAIRTSVISECLPFLQYIGLCCFCVIDKAIRIALRPSSYLAEVNLKIYTRTLSMK